MKKTGSLLQYRKLLPRAERAHKEEELRWEISEQNRGQCDQLDIGGGGEGNRKGEEFKDNSEVSSLADFIYTDAK